YVLLDDNDYLEMKSVATRPDMTLYLQLDTASVQQSDSVSLYFNDIISKNVKSMVSSDHTTEMDFNKLKSLYHMTRRQQALSGEMVSGIVTDEFGIGLPGVTVLVEGTTIGTVTDLDGRYRIHAPGDVVLRYSFIGHHDQEVPVAARSYVNVELSPDMQALQEVVVVAYGEERKKHYSYSAATVTTSETLMGMVAGVAISGTPGNSPSIRVRGMSSIRASSSPLFLIDGVLYDGNDLDLNPDDIESMDVLKGDQASGIYGSRSSNGLVIVNLKKNSRAKKLITSQTMDLSNFPGISQAKPIRRNFSDHAFWQPTLTTNSEGVATFQMTFPDDVTSWNTYFLAAHRNKSTGQTKKEVRSFKPVMGTLSLPRFLVVGDSTQILGRALNYSPDTLQLSTTFELDEQIIKNKVTVAKAHLDSAMISPATLDSLTLKYFI
ncbi:MAG: alpha-2-macroglobulin family protein, partial [Bacteroidota bacterium]